MVRLLAHQSSISFPPTPPPLGRRLPGRPTPPTPPPSFAVSSPVRSTGAGVVVAAAAFLPAAARPNDTVIHHWLSSA